MLRILRAVLLVAMLPMGLACEDGKLQLPELPKVDLPNLPLPKLDTGNLVLIKTPSGGLQLDPTGSDALTALGACSDLRCPSRRG